MKILKIKSNANKPPFQTTIILQNIKNMVHIKVKTLKRTIAKAKTLNKISYHLNITKNLSFAGIKMFAQWRHREYRTGEPCLI